MKPPFEISREVLSLCSQIHRLLGQCEGLTPLKPQPQLRKANRIQTIQGSLAIEGNTLNMEQITSLLNGKPVLGTQKEITEVKNSIEAYDDIPTYKPFSEKSFLKAHKKLMTGLIIDAGKWRSTNVGIFRGKKLAHLAPKSKQVPSLMAKLFQFLKDEKELEPLILSSIFHYEVEFIHPFSDGNGRIGRLWQTVLLSHSYPLFEFLPVESIVQKRQKEYYKALASSDKEGTSNAFVEFSLSTILEALENFVTQLQPALLATEDRISWAKENFMSQSFSRKDYLALFKNISTSTASRDLRLATEEGWLKKKGDKRNTVYSFK